MKVVVIIPARGGSKRLKDKNAHLIWGAPMIYWAIKACKESRYAPDVWVTTDSKDIASLAESFGARVFVRGEATANDFAFKQVAIREAASAIDAQLGPSDVYISLQPNSPEIKGFHLDAAIDKLVSYNKNEIISVDNNHMQNGAFRIFRGPYVYQQDLSTNCGFHICELYDVHTKEDVEILENKYGKNI
jgi:hypothetical protein